MDLLDLPAPMDNPDPLEIPETMVNPDLLDLPAMLEPLVPPETLDLLETPELPDNAPPHFPDPKDLPAPLVPPVNPVLPDNKLNPVPLDPLVLPAHPETQVLLDPMDNPVKLVVPVFPAPMPLTVPAHLALAKLLLVVDLPLKVDIVDAVFKRLSSLTEAVIFKREKFYFSTLFF